jgi:hypothetical protein
MDEVHLHQDMDLGYRWSVAGEADWVPSHYPSLKNRLNWYGGLMTSPMVTGFVVK